MKKFGKLAAGIGTLVLLSACGSGDSSSEKAISLSFMSHITETLHVDWEDEVIAKFEEEHPNVEIEVQRMGYDDYIQTLQTKFASGDAPTIFQVENTYLQKYIDNDYLTDLTDSAALENYEEDQLSMLSAAGVTYALPYQTNSLGVTYNKKIFDEVGIKELPQTEKAFYEVCEKIAAAGYTPIAGAYQETWCIMAELQADYMASILMADGTALDKVVDRSEKFADSSAWQAVYTRMQKRYAYMQKDIFGTNWDTACTMIANDEAAMVINGDWAANNIKELNPDVEIGMFPLPVTDSAADAKFVVQSPREGWAVSKAASAKEQEAAAEFLAYYTSAEVATSFVEEVNSICVVKDVTTPESSTVYDVVKALEDGTAEILQVNHNFPNEQRNAVETLTGEFMLASDNQVKDTLTALDEEFDRIAPQ